MKRKCDFQILLPKAKKQNLGEVEVPTLPPSTKPTLVLDMDDTLIKAERSMISLWIKGSSVKKTWQDDKHDFNIYKRPGLDDFLHAMAEVYDIVLFTAAEQDYADCVIDAIDPEMVLFKHRLYRQHCCTKDNKNKVKDVSKLGRDLRHLVMVDDRTKSFTGNKKNGIRIPRFDPQNPEDSELEKLTPLLLKLAKVEDVRPLIRAEKKLKKSKHLPEEPPKVKSMEATMMVSAAA